MVELFQQPVYLSLVLGITALYLSLEVLRAYAPAAIDAARKLELTPAGCMVIGVTISHIFSPADGTFWQITWSSQWWQSVWEPVLFDLGPLANLFSRQTGGILSSCFHLLGAMKAGSANFKGIMLRALALTFAAGTLYGLTAPV